MCKDEVWGLRGTAQETWKGREREREKGNERHRESERVIWKENQERTNGILRVGEREKKKIKNVCV